LITTSRLAAEHRAEAEQLAALCRQHDGLELALDLEPSPSPTGDEPGHFLAYEEGRLIGFMSMTPGSEPEVTGMVHPRHRRSGVGHMLLAAVQAECRRRGRQSLLLVCEEVSTSGRAFVEAAGARYRFSEYRMELDPAAIPAPVPAPDPIQLRRAGPDDTEALVRLTAAAFGDPEEEVRPRIFHWLRQPEQRFYLGERRGDPVGSLRCHRFPGESRVFIHTFGVRPDCQGRGCGRQILAGTLHELQAEGWRHVMIEVATDNRRALSLYHSCGFREVSAYRYAALDA
jgi:ribosomal protein S18 acetylase RimI-like enzyme